MITDKTKGEGKPPAHDGDYEQMLAMTAGAEPGSYPFGCLHCPESTCPNAKKSFTEALGNPEDPAKERCRVEEFRQLLNEKTCQICDVGVNDKGVCAFLRLYGSGAGCSKR